MASRADATWRELEKPGLHLLVLGTGFSSSRPLPDGWHELVIGRDADADVSIDEKSVSRRHAILTTGPKLYVKDLGTANGTFVHNRKLAPEEQVEVQAGDVIRLGTSVALVIQKGGGGKPDPHATPVPRAAGGDSSAPVVASDALKALHQLVRRIARGSINVLFLGETGVGKEVAAHLLHSSSPRAEKPFVAVNCASFTETLLENELFGHEPGAFTGAQGSKPGLFETAHGGTVFLDEVSEMPLALQAKLLRVLEDKQVTRLGAVKPRAVDVRFVAATNRNLELEVEAGRFRSDLYFRLNGIPILIPPLRERADEIEPLAREFVRRSCVELGRRVLEISRPALDALVRHPLPGNVRELKNVLERAVLLCDGRTIELEHLRLSRASAPAAAPAAPSASSPDKDAPAKSPALRDEVESLERDRMVAALEAEGGNVTKAAEKLGVSRRAFVMKMDRYGIPRPGKRKED
jgi:two-component system, NtrC family, response regulator AtoC